MRSSEKRAIARTFQEKSTNPDPSAPLLWYAQKIECPDCNFHHNGPEFSLCDDGDTETIKCHCGQTFTVELKRDFDIGIPWVYAITFF